MVSLAKVRGKIMLVGVSHKISEVDLMNVNFKELTLIGVRVYRICDFSQAMEFINEKKDLLNNLISHEFILDDLGKAISIASDSTNSTKVVVKIA